MEPKRFDYEIGGKRYVQRPLVLGQAIRLLEVIGAAQKLPETDDALAWLTALGEHAAEAVAAVLIPEGKAAREVDWDAQAEEIRWGADMTTTLRVIRDFFACAPASECAPLIEEIKGHLSGLLTPGSGPGSPASPAETPSAGGKSSGDSPSKS